MLGPAIAAGAFGVVALIYTMTPDAWSRRMSATPPVSERPVPWGKRKGAEPRTGDIPPRRLGARGSKNRRAYRVTMTIYLTPEAAEHLREYLGVRRHWGLRTRIRAACLAWTYGELKRGIPGGVGLSVELRQRGH